MLFEQGDMLTKGSCDPLASKSGAINRLYTLWRSAKASRREIRWTSTCDNFLWTPLTRPWRLGSHKVYMCESAVQLDGQFILPFLWISLGVFATSILMRIMKESWNRMMNEVIYVSLFCQQAPYVIWDSDIRIRIEAHGWYGKRHSESWELDHIVRCASKALVWTDIQDTLVRILEDGEADVAVYPFIYNLTYSVCRACVSVSDRRR
jgi:hypothetical protein